jgi:hypothetical protein
MSLQQLLMKWIALPMLIVTQQQSAIWKMSNWYFPLRSSTQM